MQRRLIATLVAVLVLIAAIVTYILNQEDPPANELYALTQIAEGFQRPTYVTHAGDERLFVVEQDGKIWVFENGEKSAEPFLDITDQVGSENPEQGLFSIAFAPDYAASGMFFVAYTRQPDGHTQIMRYRVSDDPNRADPDSVQEVLFVEQPSSRHNGGLLKFGRDGYLYIGLGDGSLRADEKSNAQNLTTLLGGILRVDVSEQPYAIPPDNPFVDDPDALNEIWAYGLRNPWRYSFDRETGDLWIGDVGQETYEEVNYQPADSTGGENYGWAVFEASHRTNYTDLPASDAMVMPVIEYDHDTERDGLFGRAKFCSVIGGYVYRGDALPDLQGQYLYGDWCTGVIWTTTPQDFEPEFFLETPFSFSSFGEDVAGELYLIGYDGTLWKLTAAE